MLNAPVGDHHPLYHSGNSRRCGMANDSSRYRANLGRTSGYLPHETYVLGCNQRDSRRSMSIISLLKWANTAAIPLLAGFPYPPCVSHFSWGIPGERQTPAYNTQKQPFTLTRPIGFDYYPRCCLRVVEPDPRPVSNNMARNTRLFPWYK